MLQLATIKRRGQIATMLISNNKLIIFPLLLSTDPLASCPADHPFAIEFPGRACCQEEFAATSCGGHALSVNDSRACCPNGNHINCQGRRCQNYEAALVGPTSVTLERTSSAGELEVGSAVSYTCTSAGGNPTPTLRLLVDGSEVASASGPSMSKDVITNSSMHMKQIKCEAFNDYGTMEDLETLTLYRNCHVPSLKACSLSES